MKVAGRLITEASMAAGSSAPLESMADLAWVQASYSVYCWKDREMPVRSSMRTKNRLVFQSWVVELPPS